MASLTLDWVQLAAAAGAVQGVFLCAALLAHRGNQTANRLLAALMAAFTIYLASSVYYASGVFYRYPHFFGVSYQMPWVFGPLVYLYTRAASDRAWQFQRRHLLHFVPVAISTLLAIPYYVMSGAGKIAVYERLQMGAPPLLIAVIDPFKFVSGIAYSVATLLYLRRHRNRIRHSYSNIDQVNLAWLLRLAAAAAAIWVLATSLRLGAVGPQLRDAHVSLAIAVVVYGIGYRGLRQTEIVAYESVEVEQPAADVPVTAPEPVTPRQERPASLSAAEAERLERDLLALMATERPWKDPDLTLADLAVRLESTPHKVSELLNARLRQTFYDFVNGYRVEDVQRRIASGETRTRTILNLAFDAGFASKSTFNQAFKTRTGQTPSAYKRTLAI
jgi:AraC-like DNA-binding protein